MRKIWLFFVLVILSMTLFGTKLADLPGVVKPFHLMVDGDRIYVSASTTVHMFSMKDYKLLGKFGKQGDGPGEFRFVPMIKVYPDRLIMEDRGKIMFFSRDGVYQNERKVPMPINTISQLGELWVGQESKSDEKGETFFETMNIYDKDFKLVKTLYSAEIYLNQGSYSGGKFDWPAVKHYLAYYVYHGNIYIGHSAKGFFIEVFDYKGNKLYQIDKKYEKIKLTDKFKDDFMKEKQSSSNWEIMKDRVNIIFPEYFPPFAEFRVKEGKIYVFTHVKKDKKQETVILDLKGNELNRVFLPADYGSFASIYKNNFYWLTNNAATEMWELHAVPIK